MTLPKAFGSLAPVIVPAPAEPPPPRARASQEASLSLSLPPPPFFFLNALKDAEGKKGEREEACTRRAGVGRQAGGG